MTLKDRILGGKKVITAEIMPPHGSDTSHYLKLARAFKGKVHAVNVTDNQRALMRMSNLASAALLQREGVEAIYQLTCRDRNVLALQSDLLGAQALGVKNVLALTGDPVAAGDTPAAKGVFQFESTGLLRLIRKMGEGEDLSGKSLDGKLDLFPGAVVHPGAPGLDVQIRRMEKKIQSGARFFQTQAIFDVKTMEKFLKRVESFKAPVLACVLLVQSLKTARFLNEKVPGIQIPPEMMQRLEKSSDPKLEGLKIAGELAKNYFDMCQGVHFVAIRDEEKILEVLKNSDLEKSV